MIDSGNNLLHIAILCAMPEEIGTALSNLKNISEKRKGDLKIFSGEWISPVDNTVIFVSIAWSGWGKVSASRAATRILDSTIKGKAVDFLIFTGVAGSAKFSLNQWDIVLPNELVQHDMDASPIYKKYVIPALNKSRIKVSAKLLDWANKSISMDLKKNNLKKFGKIEVGLIATGDKFISDKNLLENFLKELPGLCAVEMEGAAVAQVATQENIPWLILRVISDNADGNAKQNFNDFLNEYKNFSWNLIETLLLNSKEISIQIL